MSYLRKTEYKIIPSKSFEIIHACGGCGKKQSFINTNRFRVNANGNKLDIWLIYQCKKCKHTLNIPIFERIDKAKTDSNEYNLFLENNALLAQKYGTDSAFLRAKHLEIDINSTELEIYDADNNMITTQKPKFNAEELIVVYNKSGIKLRDEKIVSMIFDISRSQAKKMIINEELAVTHQNQKFEIKYMV